MDPASRFVWSYGCDFDALSDSWMTEEGGRLDWPDEQCATAIFR